MQQEIIVKKVPFPHTTKLFIGVIGVSAVLTVGAYSIFALGENQMKVCQEAFMKATNSTMRYNEDNPKYTIELPKYNCSISMSATGGKAPEPPKSKEVENKLVTNRWKGLDEKNIVISDWINSQEIEMLASLQNKICDKQLSSPLCKEDWLLEKLYIITESRLPGKNMFPILIGITNAESSLGINYANDKVGGKCDGRNNWGGTKYQILDDNSRVYKRSFNGFEYSNSVDQYGCNLYPFESIEEFWVTKVNGMRFGYKSCVESLTPIRCISYSYVGNPKVAEQSWINNVSSFLNN